MGSCASDCFASAGVNGSLRSHACAARSCVSTNRLPNNRGKRPFKRYDRSKAKTLGIGGSGIVHKVMRRDTKQYAALKTIKKEEIESMQSFINEVEITASMDHPNIVKLFETFEDRRHVYLVLELCEGPELFDMVMASKSLTLSQAAAIMKQMLRAVFYMHSNGVAHRDLKPKNFLLKEPLVPMSKNVLKAVDFGIAKRFRALPCSADGPAEMKTRNGTLEYMAPEILNGTVYDEKCDIWSVGVTLYFLLCGHRPFDGNTDLEIKQAVKTGLIQFQHPVFKHVPDEVIELIKSMCEVDPTKRPSAEQALNHPWVQRALNSWSSDDSIELRTDDMVEQFRHFSSANRFKRVALQVIAHHLDDESIKKLGKKFNDLDQRGDGMLTLQDMKAAFEDTFLADTLNMIEIFDQLDIDQSGSISYTEFLASMVDTQHLTEEVCLQAFRIFDRDSNGQISHLELAEMVALPSSVLGGTVPDNMEVEKILSETDTDGNLSISFEEFKAMLREAG